ncbi:phage tail protein [Pedobacter nyackensis]|uniref:Tail spike domain-containing protein n=1 Tax=Pedobacter nyackensis TaxID=475255 RepID=A0A1W1ZYW3_9SPHI|nr:phage tail protein [Pedobacter nyackensis]SMC53392.1 hypothetical protein SAMN04488101_101153 [Pedobacter nyackensis]
MQIQVLREGEVISTFDIDEGTVFNEKLQSARLITCPVSAVNALPLQEGDYIIHKGENYIINTLPEFDKDGSALQKKYNITFEAEFYLLLDKYVINSMQQKEFPLYGSALDHLNMIFASANRNDTGWTVGEVASTEGELINYNWTYVRAALDEIAAAFKLEWSFTGRTIRMVSTIGVDTGLTFEVGRGKGLHQIKRSQDSSKSVVTRVFGVGGSRNIEASYRGGVERSLIFEGRYVETPGVTAGTERVREGRYTNEEIYPRFNGVVSGVVVNRDTEGVITDVVITDNAIDFDINAHLQEGVKAKVSFRTGALTGAEFEIASYNAATKEIELIPVADTIGYVLPNDLNLPVIGDKFTLLEMKMPAAYVAAAELELRNATLQYLDDNKSARLLYGAKPDEKHLRDNNIVLKVGDRGTVIESEIDVNEILRFTEISYPLVNEFDVTAVVGNEIRYDRVVKLFADVLQTRKDVQTIDRRSVELAKRGVQNLRALESSIFDTDGKFDSDKLNVGVLTTMLAIIGTRSQNFKLANVYITDNYNANANAVSISGGSLIHFEISNPGNLAEWTITPIVQSGLVPASLYYVYCKCSKTSQVGSFVITTDKIKPEDVPGFWMFLAGVIYPVVDGWRNSDFTNGLADINPARLKIGKIISRDGLTGFDLDNSTIFGKIAFASGSNGYDNIADKPDLSIYATEGFVDAIAADLQNQIDGSITTWFYGYEPTLANVPANGWLTTDEKNQHLGDLFYDTLTGYAYRFQLAGAYGWVKITDTDITLALAKAQEAQDTADGKRRVFTATPVTPYDVGDLWTQGASGDLMRCAVARATGVYVASDWVKAVKYTDDTAVDNLVIGGRNFLRDSGVSVENDNYNIANYTYSERMVSGQVYTITIWGSLGAGKAYFGAWNENGSVGLATLNQISDGVYSRTFTGTENSLGAPHISIFAVDSSVVVNSRIDKIKLEKGNKATDWTAAPEDLQLAAQQTADAARDAAKAYADAQDYLKEVQTKAYADGIVDAEEARAIADAEAKLALAYSDATAKANAARVAAEAAAASDATNKANAAQSAAIASANATAEVIAQSKADIAQAAAISVASTDAQNKANAAYSNSLAAAQTYASTVANSAATQAEINAAADALNKANAAKAAAEATAAAAQSALTAQLKTMAYRDINIAGSQGVTIVDGGNFVTFNADIAYLKANVANIEYLEALDIVAKTLAATQGTIGGWTIGATTLYSGTDPGNYIELQSGSSPRLYMRNSAQAAGEYSMINSSGVFIMSNGNSLPTGYGSYNAVAAFKLKTVSSINDVALYCWAPSGSNAFICEGDAFFSKAVTVVGSVILDSNIYATGGNYNFQNIPHVNDIGVNVNNTHTLRVVIAGGHFGRIVRY